MAVPPDPFTQIEDTVPKKPELSEAAGMVTVGPPSWNDTWRSLADSVFRIRKLLTVGKSIRVEEDGATALNPDCIGPSKGGRIKVPALGAGLDISPFAALM